MKWRNHPDPLVNEVMDIWLPRFLTGGIPLGDVERTLEAIETWPDWGPRWMETAEHHEQLAATALSDGRVLTGAEAYRTAARCYHLAAFLSVEDPELHDRGFSKMVECHDKAMRFERPPTVKLRIPFEDTELLGLLTVPAVEGPAPVVIVLPGLDSTKETRHLGKGGLLARRLAVLSMDGPGQGEVGMRLPIRPDYETAVAAAIDVLETRPDIDAHRIGLSGASLGGYYAARAAAREPRVRATVVNCGPFDWGESFDGLPHVTRRAFEHYSGSTSMAEARERAHLLALSGERIDSPLYVIHGELDPLFPPSHGERIAALGTSEAVLNVVKNGNHGVNNLRYEAVPEANDWLARHLGGAVG